MNPWLYPRQREAVMHQPERQIRWSRVRGFLLVASLLALTGCVERRMVLTTEPFGAVVYDERNHPVGATPADRPFTYYGKYRFTAVKDGYQTMVQDVKVEAPWYQWPGLDFISENLIPWTVRDIRRIHFQMQPARDVAPETVLQEAQPLAERGRATGPNKQ